MSEQAQDIDQEALDAFAAGFPATVTAQQLRRALETGERLARTGERPMFMGRRVSIATVRAANELIRQRLATLEA